MLVYALAVLLFLEAGSRGALAVDSFFRRVAGVDASSWRLRFVRRSGSLGYGFDTWDEQRGWALKGDLKDLKVFSGKDLNSDSWGFRGRRAHAAENRAPRGRVLVLGDSFTFGEDVGDDETYSARLEASIPGLEVLNLGVHGYGHDQMLVALREIGPKVHPDVVLLGFVGEDMERNLVDFRDFAKPRFVLRDGELVLLGSPVPSPESVRRREFYRSKLWDLLVILRERLRARSPAREREMGDLTYRILEEIARETRSLGARPVFAYLPVHGEIDKGDNAMTRGEHAFFSFCRAQGIQSVYLRPFFLAKLRAGVSFKTFGHWGPLEHETAAEGIKSYLLEKDLLPPASPRP
jgi:hypothetical protein